MMREARDGKEVKRMSNAAVNKDISLQLSSIEFSSVHFTSLQLTIEGQGTMLLMMPCICVCVFVVVALCH